MSRSSSQRTTPLAASSPKALPPARTIALTFCTWFTGLRRSVSRVPGAPPRTSTLATAPASVRITVQPVGRSVRVKWPTLMPGTAVRVRLRETDGDGDGLSAMTIAANTLAAIVPPAMARFIGTSEAVFHSQLDDTSVIRAEDGAERRRADGGPGLSEADLVEEVEGLDPELQGVTAVQDEVLEEGQVGAVEPRPAHGVSALVSRPHARLRQRPAHEAARVEPLRHRLGPIVRVAHDVGAARHVADVEVRPFGHGQGETRLYLEDAVELPPAHDRAQERGLVGQLRQLRAEAQDEPVPHVEGGISLFAGQGGLDAGLVALRDGEYRPQLAADV